MTTLTAPAVTALPPRLEPASRHAGTGWFVLGHLLALAGCAVLVLLPDSRPAGVLIAGYLLLGPGDALRAALGVDAANASQRVVLALAVSFGVLMSVGLAVGALADLSSGPLLAGISVVVLGSLAAIALSRRQAVSAVPSRGEVLAWGLLALPATLAISGAKVLDTTGSPWLTLVCLGLLGAGVVWGAASGRRLARRLRPALLGFFVLAVAWSFVQRTPYLFGFDIHQEMLWSRLTAEAGGWQHVTSDPYAAMLSVTVLPASLAGLSGLELLDYFKTIGALALAGYAMGVFGFIRRFGADRVAFVVTCLLLLAQAGLWQLPAVTRQEVGLLMFVLLAHLLFGLCGRGRGVTVLAVLAAFWLATSHYTTSYVTVVMLVGGLLLAFLLRRRPSWRRTARTLPVLPVVALVLFAGGWNILFTQSSGNLGGAIESSANESGLRDEGGLVDTWLNGGVVERVTPGEYFDETRPDPGSRDWMLPYPDGLQDRFLAQATEVKPADRFGPLADLAPVSDGLYLLVRQGGNLLMVLAVAGLWLVWWRRRRPAQDASARARGDDPAARGAGPFDLDLMAVATVALVVTAAMRVNATLAQAYNAERLLMQTALFMGAAAAILVTRVLAQRQRRAALLRRVGLVLAVAVTALMVLDASGIRNALVRHDAANLLQVGEHTRRYTVSDADLAAAQWLAQRYSTSSDQVYGDTYATLVIRGMPAFQRGLFPELNPYTLDQRGYVLANSENVVHGQARSFSKDVRTQHAFPRDFLAEYKSRVYSNGESEVYR